MAFFKPVKWFVLVLVGQFLSGSVAVAAQGCVPNTDLEKVYCQLQSKGVRLPGLDDFRRNNAQMQYLLLKRHAKAENITLQKPTGSTVRSASVESKRSQKVSVKNTPPVVQPKQQVSSDAVTLNGCRLSQNVIVCSGQRYQLVENLRNSQLSDIALIAANKLQLQPLVGSSDQVRHRVLSKNYTAYIEKMLEIGLGASTMSFSQFFYTWQTAEQQGQDAVERFSQMFNYLKRDKRSLAVKARYDQALPNSLQQCMRLNQQLVVCDEGRRNWVYQRS